MSVIVQYDPAARTGNRLFQFAFGYILSRKLNCNLYHGGIDDFNIKSNIMYEGLNKPLFTRTYGDHFVPLQKLEQHKDDIIVNSFVQKSQYYIDYREELRHIFKIEERPPVNENGLTLHVRETDYNIIGAFLGYDYYRGLIDSTDFTSVTIVTDNSRCETVQKLLTDGCKLSTEGTVTEFNTRCDSRGMKDFNFMLSSPNLAISQSSFSWWAAFLGYHSKIIFPYKTDLKWWKLEPGPDDIDLYFDLPGITDKFIL